MSDLNIALVLRFIDQATAPARAAMQNVQGMGDNVQRLGHQQIATGREQLAVARRQQQQLRGEVMGIAALIGSVWASLRGPVDFEQEMSKVGAVTRANADELAAMTAQAEHLGERTVFNAQRAAEGMRFLGMAGFDTSRILAAIPGVLDLAAATDTDVGNTARLSSDMLSQFELSADRMDYVGDVLTNVSTSANTDLMLLGETMKNAGATANMVGIQFHELAGMAGLLAERGMAGAEAGTGLSRMLLALIAPSSNAVDALDELGVGIADQAGNLRDIPTILAEIRSATEDMGNVERGAYMQNIFGTYGMRVAEMLSQDAHTGALQQYQQDILETGSAARVAGEMYDTTRGDALRFGSALASVAIKISNVVLPEIRALLQTATPMVQAFGEWIAANHEIVGTVAKVAAALITLRLTVFALRWGFWLLFGSYAQLKIAWGALTVASGWLLSALAALPAVLAFLRVAFLRLAVMGASVAGTILGFLVRQLLNLALIVVWLGRALVTLAARGLMLAMAGFRLLGAAALWLGRALVALATRGAVMAVAGFRMVGAAVAWLGRALLIAGRAMLTNPLFLAIAAIAGAAYLIYQNWDGIVEYFSEKIDRVRAAFDDGLINGVFALLAEFNPFTLIMDAAEGIFTYLTGWTFAELGAALIEFIGFDPFAVLVASAESLFTYLTGWTFDDVSLGLQSAFDLDRIYQNWDGIVGYFSEKIDLVRAAFDDGLLNGVFALIAEFNPFSLQIDAAEALFTYLTSWTFAELGAALIEFIGFDPFIMATEAAERLFTYLTGWTFDDVSQGLRAAFDFDLMAYGTALMQSLWDGMLSILADILEEVADLPGAVGAVIASGATALWSTGVALIQSLWDGAVAKFNEFIGWVRDIPARIIAAIGNIDLSGVIRWPSMPSWLGGAANTDAPPDHADIVQRSEAAGWTRPAGSRALGGPVRPGFLYEINEQGQEFFMPDSPGRVIPAGALEAAQAANGPDAGRNQIIERLRTVTERVVVAPFATAQTADAARPPLPPMPAAAPVPSIPAAAQAMRAIEQGGSEGPDGLWGMPPRFLPGATPALTTAATFATSQTADAARPPLPPMPAAAPVPSMPAAAQAMRAIERGGPEGPDGLWGMLARFLPGAAPALAAAAPVATTQTGAAARPPLPPMPAAAPMMQMIERAGGAGLDALRGMMERVTSSDEGMRPSSLPQMMGREGNTAQPQGGFTIGDIHIHAAAGMDPRAIAEQVRRVIRDEARTAGYALHDGGLHAT